MKHKQNPAPQDCNTTQQTTDNEAMLPIAPVPLIAPMYGNSADDLWTPETFLDLYVSQDAEAEPPVDEPDPRLQ